MPWMLFALHWARRRPEGMRLNLGTSRDAKASEGDHPGEVAKPARMIRSAPASRTQESGNQCRTFLG